jgi:hypothetical protein
MANELVISLGASQQPCNRSASARLEAFSGLHSTSQFHAYTWHCVWGPRSPIRGMSVVVIEGTRLLPNRFSFARGAPS